VLCLVSLLVSGITEPMLTVPLGWWTLVLVTSLTRQRTVTPAGAEGGSHRARHASIARI
jgi:hypothetical protein